MNCPVCLDRKTNREIPIPRETVLALGNFDGVHLAHRALIGEAISMRDKRYPNAKCGVFCFSVHSADCLSERPHPHLCTQAEKLQKFAACGADLAILADFTALRDLSPERFVRDILQADCHCVAAVCGFNYRFGKAASGTAELLDILMNGAVCIRKPVTVDGEPVSSTRIRNLLLSGEVGRAAELLTEPYAVGTEVLPGKKLGRILGFPTINQRFPAGCVIPRYGVYQTESIVDGKTYRGVSNVGIHPTVDDPDTAVPNCETYLFDFAGDLYGKCVRTAFLRFLRPERTFGSVEELQTQIEKDIREAKERYN